MTTSTEAPWRMRFRAPRITLPLWARDQPGRLIYLATTGGKTEAYAWDRAADTHRRVTDRPEGTTNARIDPAGAWIWWYDDDHGSELGRWLREPFAPDTADGGPRPAAPDLPPAYSTGIALDHAIAVTGASTDDGSFVHLVRPDQPSRLLYHHRELASVEGLSRDGALLCISHSEHGDAQHPALRVLDLDGATITDLWDGPGLGLDVAGWSPIPGDQRLLLIHERDDLPRPRIWSPLTGAILEPPIDLPGELSAMWYPDAAALLLVHEHRGRSQLYRLDLASNALTRIDTEPGTIAGVRVHPDGAVWYGWSSAATPPEIRTATQAGSRVLLRPPGDPAPAGVGYTDHDVDGIHAFLAEPPGPRPHATVFLIHGGPTAHDRDQFLPAVQAWLDHGYAVIHVNYRGSTGYGRTWRDALIGNPGFTELADIATVHDWALREGIADPARTVLAGNSWGGYLTLFGLSIQPRRWSLGVAGVPVTDWAMQLEDEMEPLRRYDEALFDHKPIAEHPDLYRERSPSAYVERLRVPVMLLGGANDPRCPIRPIDAYVERLAELEKPHEYLRFDAGHSSMVIDEQIRQMAARLTFTARHLDTPAPT